MVRLVVVDRSAESRGKIVDRINSFLRAELPELDFLPRISVKPLAPEELKFHGAPDICIAGPEMLLQELCTISTIKRLIPDTPLVPYLTRALSSISIIEQLARLGADDVMPDNISASEFVRKIILLSRRRAKARSGKLVLVESGKGGLGVTSVVAGLGECLAEHGKKVVLLDFDFETQDLSRFLQARPFVNENLQLILEQNRPVTQECVEQCLVPVWEESELLYCMPPPAEADGLYDSRSTCARTMLSVLEVLDHLFDCVVVDGGSARGAFLKTLLRVSDKVAFIINNDPSALYASVDKLSRLRGMLSAGADLVVLENASTRFGLANKLLKDEFERAAKLEESAWAPFAVPFNRAAGRWAGSGGTLYSHGNAALRTAMTSLVQKLELIQSQQSKEGVKDEGEHSWLKGSLLGMARRRRDKPELLALPQGKVEELAQAAAPQTTVASKSQDPDPVDSTDLDVTALISGVRLDRARREALN
ncbi:MAG: ParA family protein [Deltaproteobacteria bacterium]|nr:ParA family protein [Deltaproteobacteria bacterium]